MYRKRLPPETAFVRERVYRRFRHNRRQRPTAVKTLKIYLTKDIFQCKIISEKQKPTHTRRRRFDFRNKLKFDNYHTWIH